MDPSSNEKLKSDFRVGLISFLALGTLITAIILTGGKKGMLFSDTSIVHSHLSDVGGLKKGSGVTMGGMTIGQVRRITFPDQGNYIEVAMEIRSDLRDKIKADSVPSIRTQGMLGDRYIDISMGSETSGVLPEGEPLMGHPSTQFDETLDYAKSVLNETETVLKAINGKEGTIGQLFYDETLYTSLTTTTEELRELIADLKKNPKKYVKLSLF